jgi:membrane-associated phospholipid phosphatase
VRPGARETLLLLAALGTYPLAALAIGDDPAAPLARARAFADAERALGLFVEPSVYAWTAQHGWLLTLAGFFYIWAHVPVAGWALIWTWYKRRDLFPRLRNVFLVTQGLLVATYVAIPTAPPRMLREEGFSDTLTGLWGEQLAESAHLLQSPYAAMPSGHVAWALIAGGLFALFGDRRWMRAFGWVYPPLVVLVTVMTANHFWLDAVAALALVATSVFLATVRAWPRSKLTSRAPSGRWSAPWATASRRVTPWSSSSR